MKRRNIIRIISFCCAATAVAFGCYLRERQQANYYKLKIETAYSQSLGELNESVNNIATVLDKATYMTTAPQISSAAAQLMSESVTAKNALSKLPAGGQGLTTLNRYLSQVGNYAMTLSKTMITGGTIDEEAQSNILMLRDTAKNVAQAISDSNITYNNLDSWAQVLETKITDSISEESLAGSLNGLEDDLSDYSTLIYDGPYSDHILEKDPTMIKDAEGVSQQTAVQKAATAAGCTAADLTFSGVDKGKIECYRFDNNNVSVTVSRKGGYLVYMRKSRMVGDTLLSYEQALEKAKRYLKNITDANMVQTYYFTDEGVCTINFAFLDGETICYTDLMKVGIAMDTGEVMLFESSGYLSNHLERAFETPVYTSAQAAEIVSKNLTIKETALALIPTAASEARCYEFTCKGVNDQDILVYINATTLAEEKILILLKSDGGSLTK